MIYLSYYFTNLFKFHPGPWTCAFFITGWPVSQTVCIFCISLVSVALLGVGCKGGISYHVYLSVSSIVHITPIGVFWFYKVGDRTNSVKIINGSPLLLRVSTQFWCVWHFRRCSKVAWGTVGDFAQTDLRVYFCYWGSTLLWSGCAHPYECDVLEALSGGGAWFFSSERVTFKALDLGLFCFCKWCYGECYSLPSCLVVYWRRRSNWVIFPSIRRDFLYLPYLLFSCIRRIY